MRCSQCQGVGYQYYDEDGRTVRDACYHCETTGQVDEDTYFRDRLLNVAHSLAYWAEAEYRKACNDDPDGDGYDLGAYENQMSPWDYFRTRVWDRESDIMAKLEELPKETQEVLVAWNEYSP